MARQPTCSRAYVSCRNSLEVSEKGTTQRESTTFPQCGEAAQPWPTYGAGAKLLATLWSTGLRCTFCNTAGDRFRESGELIAHAAPSEYQAQSLPSQPGGSPTRQFRGYE